METKNIDAPFRENHDCVPNRAMNGMNNGQVKQDQKPLGGRGQREIDFSANGAVRRFFYESNLSMMIVITINP